jgi:hypothetical protein
MLSRQFGLMSLDFSKEDGTGVKNLGVINIWIKFKAIELDEKIQEAN